MRRLGTAASAAVWALLLPAVSTAVEGGEADPGISNTPALNPPAKEVVDAPPPPRQPSFVENAGNLNRNEHAVLLFVDAEVLPAAAMIGYRYGLLSWWDIGFDAGGNLGVFQALLHTKMINLKTKKTELFWWGFTFKTGYKWHQIDYGENFIIDDKSWIYVFENPFAFRFGKTREKALFLTTKLYIDQDLREPRRQYDYYLAPAHIGYEMVIGKYTNFFIEAGVMWSINGSEVEQEVNGNREIVNKYKGDWFPVMQIGFAARTGDKTAKYGKIHKKKKE